MSEFYLNNQLIEYELKNSIVNGGLSIFSQSQINDISNKTMVMEDKQNKSVNEGQIEKMFREESIQEV
ncbi:hypothetical protein I6U48_16660 [Clostridium sp. PL3]|uniref:Uncharacterized protein n=1 Tax=Clostridium thailandense TaxID=2794346 RepID=A0A949TVX2_9CLOT|nr:hypothetical protein [Clostridium thailandense]MBV7274526.1 hypothetical protein [Clostridium thailandense]